MPPVVGAIGAAIASAGAAVASVGIMTSMAYAGTALTVVGAVTKNQKLMKIGSIVGGIGTLGSIGAFGAGAKTLGMSEAAKQSAIAKAATAGATSYGAGARESLSRTALKSGAADLALAPGAGVRAVGAGGGQLSASGGLMRSVMPPGLSSNLMNSAAAEGGKKTLLQKLGGAATWMRDNPDTTKILASTGSELANYLTGVPDAELDYLKSMSNRNDVQSMQMVDAIEQEKRRRQNLNAGYQQVNAGIQFNQPPAGLLAKGLG